MAMSTPSDPTTPPVGGPVGAAGAHDRPNPAGGAVGGPPGGSAVQEKAQQVQEKASETASAVADQGKAVASTAGEQAKSVADTAMVQAKTVSQEAVHQAQRVMGDATGELQTQLHQRVTQVAEKAKTTGDQLKALAEGRTDEAGPAADWARQASDQLTQFSSRLDEMGLQGATDEVKRFARQRPMAFLAGAAAAGFLIGRTVRNASGSGSNGADQLGQPRQLPAAGRTSMGTTPELDLAGGTTPGVGTTGMGTTGLGTTVDVPGTEINRPTTTPTGEF